MELVFSEIIKFSYKMINFSNHNALSGPKGTQSFFYSTKLQMKRSKRPLLEILFHVAGKTITNFRDASISLIQQSVPI
jgi:hypothetical protein